MEYVKLNYEEEPILSDVLLNFCKRNNISSENIKKISKSEMSDNFTTRKINPIINYYGITQTFESYGTLNDIYIRDIIGFESVRKAKNLFEILNNSYSDSNETYSTRMNHKLGVSPDKMIENMTSSFKGEPICLDEVEGKYVVSINGFHRTSILRFLYLNEVMKGEKPIEEIDEQFKIKAEVVTKFDMPMTYINYLLNMLNAVKSLDKEYVHGFTGNFVINHNDDKKEVLDRTGVINYFNEVIKENNIDEYTLDNIKRNSQSIPSFKDFLKEYAPELIKEEQYGSLS